MMRRWRTPALAAATGGAALLLAGLLLVQPGRSAATPDNNFRTEHEIGQRFSFDPANLPRGGATASNGPRIISYSGQVPAVPPGFTATLWASGIDSARRMLVLPNGDVVVAQQFANRLVRLRDNGTGRAVQVDAIDAFNLPYGLATRDKEVLVADNDGIWRVAFSTPTTPRALTASGVFGTVSGHTNRPLAINPENGRLYVGVGSMGNLAVEPEPKATVQRFDADGTNQATFAGGLRNPTTLAIHPRSGDVWALVQERDGLGDNLPNDYLAQVKRDGFYGWPYAYLGPHPQPGFANLAPRRVALTLVPDLLLQAHSSPMDLAFYYDRTQFPPEFRDGAFIAMKGSWNRSKPTGYKVVWAPFKDDRPVGYYQNFATGFWVSGNDRADAWGRPAALAIDKTGALLVADDAAGTIWRITYGSGL